MMTPYHMDPPDQAPHRVPDLAAGMLAGHAMLPEGSVVVAMVSGGADSTALLRVLAGAVHDSGCSLSVLHVNHMLRGQAADDDARFVEQLADELGVPCRVVRYDVSGFAEEHGLNLEDAGRQIRYRFAEEELDARCDAAGVPRSSGRIAVGHTLDDRVETFLMRVAAGAGASGFTSLRPVRGRIVRPLLGARHGELIAHLEALGQPWREDATNADTSRLRSHVRHELVPVFERLNPSFATTLARSIDVLADEDDLLSEMAGAFARDFASAETHAGAPVGSANRVSLDRAMMLTLSRPMARRTVRSALADAFPEALRLEFAHVDALVDGLADDSFARDLPGGLRAVSEYGRMVVSHADDRAEPLAPVLLSMPGTTLVGDSGSIHIEPVDPSDVSGGERFIVVDADRIGGGLVADSVREGDRMRPLGMTGTRKLSDMLIDAKVPRRRRGAVPVLRDGASIVWLAGVRMSEDYRVTSSTRRAWRLTWKPQE